MDLKILSWNIWYNGDIKAVNNFLEESDADIIGLQEVTKENDEINLSKKLKETYNYKYVTVFKRKIKTNKIVEVGNAILSKYKIISERVCKLSKIETRVAIQATVQVQNHNFSVFCTHLLHTHQQPSKIQELQAEKLINIIPKEKVILMGDFNALPNSNAIKIINKVLKNADAKMLPTWSNYPKGCEGCLPEGIIYKLDNIL